jgi:hypothetical protein
MAQRFDIVKGPDAQRFMVAHHFGNSHERVLVEFYINAVGRLKITVNSAERKDGSGRNWNFRGYIVESVTASVNLFGDSRRNGKRCRGSYSTDSRAGWLEVDDAEPVQGLTDLDNDRLVNVLLGTALDYQNCNEDAYHLKQLKDELHRRLERRFV